MPLVKSLANLILNVRITYEILHESLLKAANEFLRFLTCFGDRPVCRFVIGPSSSSIRSGILGPFASNPIGTTGKLCRLFKWLPSFDPLLPPEIVRANNNFWCNDNSELCLQVGMVEDKPPFWMLTPNRGFACAKSSLKILVMFCLSFADVST